MTQCKHVKKVCASCSRKAHGGSLKCHVCTYPSGFKKCVHCKSNEWHTTGRGCCVICASWYNLKARNKKYCGTLSEIEYRQILADATVCEDSGHLFDNKTDNTMMRKSIDRIDNSRGYELGNVRVVTWQANNMRGDMGIDIWKDTAAAIRAQNLWPSILKS